MVISSVPEVIFSKISFAPKISLLFSSGLSKASVIARIARSSPLAWPVSDEMSTYLFVLMSFMGTAIAARRKAHLGLSIVTDHVSPRARLIISMVMYAISALFCLLIVIFGIQMVISQYQMGQETATMQWPE